jgi:hypothetical protein
MGRNQVHSDEPFLQWQLGILKDSANSTREIVLALVTTVTTISTSDTVVLATVWTYNVITPTSLCKSILANILAVEVVDNRDN